MEQTVSYALPGIETTYRIRIDVTITCRSLLEKICGSQRTRGEDWTDASGKALTIDGREIEMGAPVKDYWNPGSFFLVSFLGGPKMIPQRY
jgi:hypothetical protein